MNRIQKTLLVLGALLCSMILGCASGQRTDGDVHRWWQGLGPVIPHDSFPSDCRLCHVGDSWNDLAEDFEFDHAVETGYALEGAHTQAQCLRCHNDRGPVQSFLEQGCAGCHEDWHQGELGQDCQRCHTEQNWRAFGQREMHSRTRFPLTGAHAQGRLSPLSPGCVCRLLLPGRHDLRDLSHPRPAADRYATSHPTRLGRQLRPVPHEHQLEQRRVPLRPGAGVPFGTPG